MFLCIALIFFSPNSLCLIEVALDLDKNYNT